MQGKMKRLVGAALADGLVVGGQVATGVRAQTATPQGSPGAGSCPGFGMMGGRGMMGAGFGPAGAAHPERRRHCGR